MLIIKNDYRLRIYFPLTYPVLQKLLVTMGLLNILCLDTQSTCLRFEINRVYLIFNLNVSKTLIFPKLQPAFVNHTVEVNSGLWCDSLPSAQYVF